MNKKRKIITIMTLVIVAIAPLFLTNMTNAAVSYDESTMKKALYGALNYCYSNSAFSTEAGEIGEYFQVDSSEKRLKLLKEKIGGEKVKVYIPPFNEVTEKITCQELLLGGKNFQGILSLSGHDAALDDASGMDGLLRGLGYTKVKDTVQAELGGKERCLRFTYQVNGTEEKIYSNYLCALVDSSGNIIRDGYNPIYTWDSVPGGEEIPCEQMAYRFDPYGRDELWVNTGDCGTGGGYNDLTGGSAKSLGINISEIKTWDNFKSVLQSNIAKVIGRKTLGERTVTLLPPEEQGVGGDSEAESNTGKTYSVGISFFAGDRIASIIKYLSDGQFSNSDSLKFVDNEKTSFYHALITKFFFNGESTDTYWACNIQDDDWSKANYTMDINITPQNTPGNSCKLDESLAEENASKKVATLDGDTFDVKGKNKKNLAEVVAVLNELVKSNPDAADGTIIPDERPQTEDVENCMNSGGAESLGWIVCSVLDLVADAVEGVYDNWIEPALMVDSVLFDTDEDTGATTYEAWTTFQNFANIIFIILFAAVIFSQLTGVGIDNYGIKKVLPKLIVVAVLVNLSYIICEIAIDLSNILGSGLQNLFRSIPVKNMDVNVLGEEYGGMITSTAFTAVPIVGGLMSIGAAVWKSPAILLTLLVSALGVFIAVVFLFAILSAREAAIVIFTVISPVAFVCYALPNTKKLFDKWLNIQKGLLLVYPICGLLVGGGNYASRLLLATVPSSGKNGFLGAFMAMIVGIVPIFFIPTVLRGSFAAMGNLGAKISGLGDRLRGRATRGIRESDGFKRRQTRMNAGMNRNGELTWMGRRRANINNSRFGKARGWDRRQAAYVEAAKKDITASETAGAILAGALATTEIPKAGGALETSLGSGFAAGTEGAYYGRQFLDAASNGDVVSMNAAIEAMRSSGMQAKDIAKIVRYAQNNGNLDNIDSDRKAAWWRSIAKKYGGDFLATDFELNDFARKSGNGNNGQLGAYGAYASSGAFKLEDVKPEDVIKLSGDSLAAMIIAGKIDQGMAKRVMALNPNISSDKRIMLGACADGMVGTNVSVDDFKRDAADLANGSRQATHNTIAAAAGGTSLSSSVAKWTRATAQDVNVENEVDVNILQSRGGQVRPVDVDIRGANSGSNPNPSPNPNPNPNSNSNSGSSSNSNSRSRYSQAGGANTGGADGADGMGE